MYSHYKKPDIDDVVFLPLLSAAQCLKIAKNVSYETMYCVFIAIFNSMWCVHAIVKSPLGIWNETYDWFSNTV